MWVQGWTPTRNGEKLEENVEFGYLSLTLLLFMLIVVQAAQVPNDFHTYGRKDGVLEAREVRAGSRAVSGTLPPGVTARLSQALTSGSTTQKLEARSLFTPQESKGLHLPKGGGTTVRLTVTESRTCSPFMLATQVRVPLPWGVSARTLSAL